MIDVLIKRVSVTYKCYEMYAHRGKNVQLLMFISLLYSLARRFSKSFTSFDLSRLCLSLAAWKVSLFSRQVLVNHDLCWGSFDLFLPELYPHTDVAVFINKSLRSETIPFTCTCVISEFVSWCWVLRLYDLSCYSHLLQLPVKIMCSLCCSI